MPNHHEAELSTTEGRSPGIVRCGRIQGEESRRHVGSLLRAAIQSAGVSQRECARSIGVQETVLRQKIAGRVRLTWEDSMSLPADVERALLSSRLNELDAADRERVAGVSIDNLALNACARVGSLAESVRESGVQAESEANAVRTRREAYAAETACRAIRLRVNEAA